MSGNTLDTNGMAEIQAVGCIVCGIGRATLTLHDTKLVLLYKVIFVFV